MKSYTYCHYCVIVTALAVILSLSLLFGACSSGNGGHEDMPALLTIEQGEVDVERGRDVIGGTNGMEIIPGDILIVSDDGIANIAFFEGSSSHLEGPCEVEITVSERTTEERSGNNLGNDELQPRKNARDESGDTSIELKLNLGKTINKIGALGTSESSFRVRSANVIAGAWGTEYTVMLPQRDAAPEVTVESGLVYAAWVDITGEGDIFVSAKMLTAGDSFTAPPVSPEIQERMTPKQWEKLLDLVREAIDDDKLVPGGEPVIIGRLSKGETPAKQEADTSGFTTATELTDIAVYPPETLNLEFDRLLGTRIWALGYYGDDRFTGDGVGFLIDDYERLTSKVRLPGYSFMRLDGNLPARELDGSEIMVYGEVKDFAIEYGAFTADLTPLITVEQYVILDESPTRHGDEPYWYEAEATADLDGLIIRDMLKDAGHQILALSGDSLSSDLVEVSSGTSTYTVSTPQGTRATSCDRALIITGGIDDSQHGKADEYDIEEKYRKLRELGFSKDQIEVMYYNGASPINVDGENIVDQAATIANIKAMVEKYRSEIPASCTLAIFISDHGTGYDPAEGWSGARPAIDGAAESGTTYPESTQSVNLKSQVSRATTAWTTSGNEWFLTRNGAGNWNLYRKDGANWTYQGSDDNGDGWITEDEAGFNIDGDASDSEDNTGFRLGKYEPRLTVEERHKDRTWDTDENGDPDVRSRWVDPPGRYYLERLDKEGNWRKMAEDTNGDYIIDSADGGIDWDLDGNTNGQVGFHEGACLVGDETLWDDQLASMLKPLGDKNVHILVMMDTCYSGGFVANLQGIVERIYTSADEEHVTWNRLADNTVHPGVKWVSVYSHEFIKALNGLDVESWNSAHNTAGEADTKRWESDAVTRGLTAEEKAERKNNYQTEGTPLFQTSTIVSRDYSGTYTIGLGIPTELENKVYDFEIILGLQKPRWNISLGKGIGFTGLPEGFDTELIPGGIRVFSEEPLPVKPLPFTLRAPDGTEITRIDFTNSDHETIGYTMPDSGKLSSSVMKISLDAYCDMSKGRLIINGEASDLTIDGSAPIYLVEVYVNGELFNRERFLGKPGDASTPKDMQPKSEWNGSYDMVAQSGEVYEIQLRVTNRYGQTAVAERTVSCWIETDSSYWYNEADNSYTFHVLVPTDLIGDVAGINLPAGQFLDPAYLAQNNLNIKGLDTCSHLLNWYEDDQSVALPPPISTSTPFGNEGHLPELLGSPGDDRLQDYDGPGSGTLILDGQTGATGMLDPRGNVYPFDSFPPLSPGDDGFGQLDDLFTGSLVLDEPDWSSLPGPSLPPDDIVGAPPVVTPPQDDIIAGSPGDDPLIDDGTDWTKWGPVVLVRNFGPNGEDWYQDASGGMHPMDERPGVVHDYECSVIEGSHMTTPLPQEYFDEIEALNAPEGFSSWDEWSKWEAASQYMRDLEYSNRQPGLYVIVPGQEDCLPEEITEFDFDLDGNWLSTPGSQIPPISGMPESTWDGPLVIELLDGSGQAVTSQVLERTDPIQWADPSQVLPGNLSVRCIPSDASGDCAATLFIDASMMNVSLIPTSQIDLMVEGDTVWSQSYRHLTSPPLSWRDSFEFSGAECGRTYGVELAITNAAGQRNIVAKGVTCPERSVTWTGGGIGFSGGGGFIPCFAPETLVLMTDGSSATIESISIGAEVLSYDEQHSSIGRGKVIDTGHGEADQYYLINNALKVAPPHPFYIAGIGWRAVEDLQPGDFVISPEGVTEIFSIERVSAGLEIHNIEIDPTGSFFVSADGVNFFLVHQGY